MGFGLTMSDPREENRRRLAELAEAERRKRAAAEPAIARKEAALAEARAKLARTLADTERMQAELDASRSDPAADPANDDSPTTPEGG